MSKKSDITLLLPGSSGWQLWQGTPEQGFNNTLDDGPALASDIEKFPSGALTMGFPVREALAIPFKATTNDEAMFEDLGEMHLEKSGIRPEMDAGKLTDIFPAGSEDEQSILLNVVLSVPRDGHMPMRSPGEFDISARFFPMQANAVTLWRELERWVFAITRNDHLVYFQSLSGSDNSVEFTQNAIREINLALTQLALQGMRAEPESMVIWTTGSSSDIDETSIASLSKALSAEVITTPKPRPVLPNPISKLVPADVRAERQVKAQKQQRNLAIAALLLLYLGLAGYFGWKYYLLDQKSKKQEAEIAAVKQDYDVISVFDNDWEELSPVVNSKTWPLNHTENVVKHIPKNETDIRLLTFEANGMNITIKGEAANHKKAGEFSAKLKRYMKDFEWNAPLGSENKRKRWGFTYTATRIEQ